MKQALTITLLLVFSAIHAWSQTDTSQSSGQTPWHPTMNGESGSLAFSSEAERVNLLTGGVTLGGTYDDNAFNTFNDHVGSLGYTVMPNLSLVEERSRTLLTLNYNPGFLWSQRSPVQYSAGQNVDFNLQWRLTERLSAKIHENFVDQNTAFSQLNEVPLLSSGIVLNQPNQSTITPLTTVVTNAPTLDVMDQIGEATSIGVTGTFYKLNYHDTSSSPVPLFDNESWSGQAFYSHHLSAQYTVGVTCTFQKFATFGQILEHGQTENLVLFYRVDFKPGVFLSVFAGPDHSMVNDQFQLVLVPGISVPVNQTNSMWLIDEGLTFGWQGQRTTARINLVHHVTDGGGLAGAVQLYSATLGLRRQMSKTLSGDLAVNYGDNDPLSHSYGNSTFAGYGGTIGVDRTLGAHFSVGMRYGRSSQRFEQYLTTTVPSFPANHNQGWITVSYRFSRPLGS
jgi:hypothetical protein